MATLALDPLREISAANDDLLRTAKHLLALAGHVEDPTLRGELRNAISQLLEANGRINQGVDGVLRRLA